MSWGDPLHLWLTFKSCRDPPSSLSPQRRMDNISWCNLRCFCFRCEGCRVSCFMWADPCPSSPFMLVFLLTGWHRVINWWHLHLGGYGYRRPHSSRLGLSSCLISWGGRNDGSLSKGRTLPWSTLDKHISSPCHKGFSVCTPTSRWLLSSTC